MILKTLPVGPIMANCYIIGCKNTREAAVIDPGDEADKILMSLAEEKLKVKYILNTHGHFDHVGANRRLKEVTGAPIVIHPEDAPMLGMISQAAASFGMASENSPPPDLMINDGDEISFGDITLKVIHTPGHSLGGVSFYTDGIVFVGDTLFAGSIGRTDFPGGDYNTLISSVKNKLFVLGDNVKAYTGHGPVTTIGQEKRTNPFLR
jgi:hydroxyacylglutathione hydrolase